MASRTGPQTKSITVYRNGDAFFTGRKVVVNQRQVCTFDGLLASLTPGLDARFGAVRKLFSLAEGRRLRRLDELEHGGVYVAGGNEAFKKLDYCRITNKRPLNGEKEQLKAPIQPVVHSKTIVPARCTTTKDESRKKYVIPNDDKMDSPARIRFPKCTLKSWENGSEKIRAFKYDQRIHGRDLWKESNMIQGKDLISANPKTKHANHLSAHTGFREDLEHTARGHMKKDKAEGAKHEKQASRNPALFQMGEGSVFNAQNKRREMAGALEVEEDSQLKVDLPIDLVEAKTVEEEYRNGSRCTSSSKASLQESANFSLSAGEPKVREVSSKLGDTVTDVPRFQGWLSPSALQSEVGSVSVTPGKSLRPARTAGSLPPSRVTPAM